jgi:hypothetical protein
MVLKVTLKNISVISWRSVLLVEEIGEPVENRIPLMMLYSIQHYVIKFVNDLRQVGGFLPVLRFPPPIKLTATI